MTLLIKNYGSLKLQSIPMRERSARFQLSLTATKDFGQHRLHFLAHHRHKFTSENRRYSWRHSQTFTEAFIRSKLSPATRSALSDLHQLGPKPHLHTCDSRLYLGIWGHPPSPFIRSVEEQLPEASTLLKDRPRADPLPAVPGPAAARLPWRCPRPPVPPTPQSHVPPRRPGPPSGRPGPAAGAGQPPHLRAPQPNRSRQRPLRSLKGAAGAAQRQPISSSAARPSSPASSGSEETYRRRSLRRPITGHAALPRPSPPAPLKSPHRPQPCWARVRERVDGCCI